MPTFDTIRRVPFTPQQMYALVADVERYPQFLPLCNGLRVRTREAQDGGEVLVADMEVGYRAIRERFTSRVTLAPAALQIASTYVDGPFQRMDNRWTFVDVAGQPGHSDVIFFIDYEFKSMLLQMLMGSMFDAAFRKFTGAFEARAKQVYGMA